MIGAGTNANKQDCCELGHLFFLLALDPDKNLVAL